MVGRGEITDKAWEQIAPLLPENGERGGQWRDHRKVINGILWKLRTGAPWRDQPERYDPWQTFYDRFDRPNRMRWGKWNGGVSVDSSVARAHQHVTGARCKRSQGDEKRG